MTRGRHGWHIANRAQVKAFQRRTLSVCRATGATAVPDWWTHGCAKPPGVKRPRASRSAAKEWEQARGPLNGARQGASGKARAGRTARHATTSCNPRSGRATRARAGDWSQGVGAWKAERAEAAGQDSVRQAAA
ncbi:hypothetical protein ERJ75_000290100 [Trypanosoma vivax]|nr:hypothetical protein ERJ75_000290400 [Trypanosoma vivax]KAH8618342.1 hypothetical protein ERJ75_000290100 [Trypanosoma vivax]